MNEYSTRACQTIRADKCSERQQRYIPYLFSVIAGRVPLCGCQRAKEIMRDLSQICRIPPSGDSGSAGKPRSADHTPVSDFRDLRFCCCKSGCARRFPIFPRTSENSDKKPLPKAKTRQIPLGKQPLKRKTAFRRFPRTKPDAPSQGLITIGSVRKSPIPVNPLPATTVN